MVKRLIIYIMGICILGLGLVLNTKTGLGTSPIVSIPFVLSHATSISLGNWTFIIYILFIIVQILLYRKVNLPIILQIPFSYLMGWIVDMYNKIITISNPSLPVALLLLLAAIVCTASGAFMMVSMDLIVNPGDGIVASIASVSGQPFGKCKLVFDFSCMILATALSFVLLKGIVGIGVGTIICVFSIGTVISMLDMKFGRILAEIVLKSKNIGRKYES